MENKRNIKTNINRAVWLVMAVLCIVFSSAFKRLIQLRADEKSGIANNFTSTRSLSQNIKDGHRERHEYQAIVQNDKQPSPLPSLHPASHLVYLIASRGFSVLYKANASRIRCNDLQPVFYGSLPLFLQFRKLEI